MSLRGKKSPDITANMLRDQLAAQVKVASAQRFVWPAPPYYEFSDPSQHSDECMLVFRDGAKTSGTMLDFRPEEAQLKFRSHDSSEDLNVAFSSLLRVQLLQPLALRRQPMQIDDSEALFAASERQPFAIGLANGKTFLGKRSARSTRCAACSCFRRSRRAMSRAGSCRRTRRARRASASRWAKCWSTRTSPPPRRSTRRSPSSKRCARGASATTSPSTRSSRRSS